MSQPMTAEQRLQQRIRRGWNDNQKECAVCERLFRAFARGVNRHRCDLPGADPFGFRLAKGEPCNHRISGRSSDGRCTSCGKPAKPPKPFSKAELEAAVEAMRDDSSTWEDCRSCRGTGTIRERADGEPIMRGEKTRPSDITRKCMDCRGEKTVPPRPRRDQL